jgi:hypothetical protein
MNVSAIDTLEVSKALTAVGFTDQQAEALTRQLRLAQNIDLSNLATKDDLNAQAATLRAEWKTALAENKADIIKWVVGMGFAQAGLVVALIKLIH